MKEINGYFVPETVLELVKSGKKLEAIQALREWHCVSWRLAADIVAVVIREVAIRCPSNQNEQTRTEA